MIKQLTATAAALVMLTAGAAASASALAGDAGRDGVATFAGAARSPAEATGQAAGRRGFEEFLRRYEAANSAFLNGDPGPWLSIVATSDPASIFGGFGGLGESGVDEVHQRYLLAARAFRPSGAEASFEYLVKHVDSRTAYTVAIERSNVLYAGHTEVQEQVLRVTMIFRLERGEWKIVHRHADDMVELELPQP